MQLPTAGRKLGAVGQLAHAEDFGGFLRRYGSGIAFLPKQLRSHAQRFDFAFNSLYFQLLTLEHFVGSFHGCSRESSHYSLAGHISLHLPSSADHITEVQVVTERSTSVAEVIGMAL